MPRYKVIGPRRIAGVALGGEVELDPDLVNIPALLVGGHVEPVKPKMKLKAEGSDG